MSSSNPCSRLLLPKPDLAMPELSLHNIDAITQDVLKEEIIFSHLAHELIDHLCCDIENEMEKGLSFSEAYQAVKRKMGPRRIREIQEETLYAVDTKYRYMKNLMKISGVAGTVILGFAALFKIQHWVGAGIMMTLGAFLLALLFLPSALVVLWKESHNTKRVFFFISSFLAGMLFIFGVLFKIQHWQGANIVLSLAIITGLVLFLPLMLSAKLKESTGKTRRFAYMSGTAGAAFYFLGMFCKMEHWPFAMLFMIAGMIFLFLISLPLYTWLTFKNESSVSARYIFIIVGSMAIIIPALLMNLSLQRSYDDGFYIQMQQQQALCELKIIQNRMLITRVKDSLALPAVRNINDKTVELLDLISKGEQGLVAATGGNQADPLVQQSLIRQTGNGQIVNYSAIQSPFEEQPVRELLLPGCKYRQELNKALAEYKKLLSGFSSGKDLKSFAGLLDPSLYLPGEKALGSEITLMTGLHSMLLLRTGILTAELSVIAPTTR